MNTHGVMAYATLYKLQISGWGFNFSNLFFSFTCMKVSIFTQILLSINIFLLSMRGDLFTLY